jgi:7-cyano-7-deazaguanine synthase
MRQRRQGRALVLLSGGIDSAVAALVAAKQKTHVHYLTFDYGQENRKELACARRIAKTVNGDAPHLLLSLDFTPLAVSGRSGLLSSKGSKQATYGYYVPGRNMIFLAYAAAVAEVNEIDTIFVGSNLQDAIGTPLPTDRNVLPRGYPDSGKSFIDRAEHALNGGLKYGKIRIMAPLLGMNKFAAIRYGHDNRLDFGLTWSCYKSKARACGRCPACYARVLNFHWAGLTDPLLYELPQSIILSVALSGASALRQRS